MILLFAASANAEDSWRDRAAHEVRQIPGSTAPLLQPRFSATEEEEAGSDAAAEAARSNGITTYCGNAPPHWDPTMADAPSWLKKRYSVKPRLRR